MTRIAVTSRSFSKHPVLRAELETRYGPENITFNDAGLSLAGQDLIHFLRGHERAITALERLDAAVFAALPELNVVSKYGVGIDMIDLDAMRRHGVRFGWTKGVNRRAVAELVVACVIAQMRQVPAANREVRAGDWRQVKGAELTGKTVGIVGCGHVGKDLVRLVSAFGCRILAHDIRDFHEFYAEFKVEPMDLDALLAASDIVSVHLPLDNSTRGILNRTRLAKIKPGALLVNMARGGLVDENAVFDMLESGQLGGAVFDVFAKEPPENRALLTHHRMLALPHIAGSSEEGILAMGRAAIEGLESNDLPDPNLS